MTDKVSSTVITGRRMNGPESPEPLTGTSFAVGSGFSSANDLDPRRPRSFTSRSPSCSSASFIRRCAFCSGSAVRCRGGLRRVGLRRDFRSRRKRKLASDNHGLVWFHTALDYSEIALLTLPRRDRTKLDSVVRFHYEHERPGLANLHGLRWHKRGALECVQNEADEDKFGWPQCAIGIRSDPTSFHSYGAGLHCVVDEIQIADPRRNRTIREIGFYFYIRTTEIFSHQRQIVLGDREVRVNGVQTLYRDKSRAGRSNQVADINIAKTNSSVDGRFDEAIIKVYLSRFGRCLRLFRVRQSNVVVLLRDHLSRTQVFLSLERRRI